MVSVNVLLFVVLHAIHFTNPSPNPDPNPKLNPKQVPSPNPNPNPSPNQGLYEIRLTRRLGGGVRKKRELFEDLFIALAACGWYSVRHPCRTLTLTLTQAPEGQP